MSRQKFSMKKYEKDRRRCYEMSKSGVNLDQLSKTEDRILSKRINTLHERLRGSADIQRLAGDADECGKKSTLGLYALPVKDRGMDMCKYCDINI